MSRYSFIHITDNLIDRNFMAASSTDLLTTGNIAKELKIPDAKVKNIIQQLGIKPTAKKGVCSYYNKDIIPKIKKVIK